MELITKFDEFVFSIMEAVSCTFLDWFFKIFTYLGDAGIVWIVIGVVLALRRKTRSMGCCLLVCLALTYVVNDKIIKEIVERARPFVADPSIEIIIDKPSGFSFPSGHTASSFAAATAIFLFDRKYGALAYVLALIIGISRVYLFVHYPSDVLCGMVVGVVCAFLITVGFRMTEKIIIDKLRFDS